MVVILRELLCASFIISGRLRIGIKIRESIAGSKVGSHCKFHYLLEARELQIYPHMNTMAFLQQTIGAEKEKDLNNYNKFQLLYSIQKKY